MKSLPGGQIMNHSSSVSTCDLHSSDSDALLLGWERTRRQKVGFSDVNAPIESRQEQPLHYAGPHLMTVAPTGAGKGRCCAIPALLSYPGQMVVVDIKGELYLTTHRRREELGQQVVKLDPFRVISSETDGLDPLDILDLPNADIETDCQTLAKLLSAGKEFTRDPFWHLIANGLNSGILGYVGSCEERPTRSFTRLCEILHTDDVVYNLAVYLDTVGKKMPKMSYQEIASFLQLPEKETRPSALATAQAFTKGLNSQRVVDALSKSNFSLADFRSGKPMTIYLILPPERLESHAGLLTLWFGTFLKAIFSRTSAPALRTLMLIDEAAQLGKFQMLETAITLCRSYGVRIWTFWQNLQQLQECYPVGWKTITNNCMLQTFGVTNRLMAEELSQVMDCSVRDLLDLPADEQWLQFPNSQPVRSRRLDYLRHPQFAGMYDANRFHDGPPKTATVSKTCDAGPQVSSL
jgi:type IV secretion system protein VirD4